MITIDIICLFIVGVLLLQGIWYGFVKGLLFILGWVAAGAGAYFSYSVFGDSLEYLFSISGTTSRILSIFLGFIIPFLLFSFLGRFLHGIIKGSILGLPNRILGALLGLMKAVILCSIVMTIVHLVPLSGSWEEGRANSIAYKVYLKELKFFNFDTKRPDIKGIVQEGVDTIESELKESAEKATEETLQ